MNPWIIAYLIGSAFALLLLVFLVLSQQSKIDEIQKDMNGRISQLPWINERTRKIEKAVDWFLGTKGLKLERRPASWEWTVMPTTSPEHELNDWWRQIQMHREEIVYALYESTKNALEDHDKEKEKKKKGKKK